MKALFRDSIRAINRLGSRRECPLCGWSGFTFEPAGVKARGMRRLGSCPSCRSRERHRLADLVLMKERIDWSSILHVAPEPCIERWFRSLARDYLSIDLGNEAMRKMDLLDLQLPDNSFTMVYCSNVLEHIPQDHRAMSEIFRVLKPAGLAVIQVPIGGEKTYEDNTITTPEARLKAFLQRDHVRFYGRDIVDRLREAGFEVGTRRTRDFDQRTIRRCGLEFYSTNEVFLCRKPAAATGSKS